MEPTEGASCTAGPDAHADADDVVMLDVAAILDEVLPDGVDDAGGVGTDDWKNKSRLHYKKHNTWVRADLSSETQGQLVDTTRQFWATRYFGGKLTWRVRKPLGWERYFSGQSEGRNWNASGTSPVRVSAQGLSCSRFKWTFAQKYRVARKYRVVPTSCHRSVWFVIFNTFQSKHVIQTRSPWLKAKSFWCLVIMSWINDV